MTNLLLGRIQQIILLFAIGLQSLFCSAALAQDAGKMVRLQSARAGVEIPVFIKPTVGAVATVILLPGGAGGIGQLNDRGWPNGGNFLIRSAPLFADSGLNIAEMAKPSDVNALTNGFRISPEHMDDIRRVVKHVKEQFGAPVWLVGTSWGTVSVAAAGIALRDEGLISGIVLTSSVTAYKKTGAVPTQALDRINVPVLVMHHENDSCGICRPYEVSSILRGLKNAPVKKQIMVNGGGGAEGDPCEAAHYHGYIGMEKEAVEIITNWIKNPTS